MRVTYTRRDVINDRPPLLNLEPNDDRDQATLSKIHDQRPMIVYGFGRDQETMRFRHMELLTGFEGDIYTNRLEERIEELQADNAYLRKQLDECRGEA